MQHIRQDERYGIYICRLSMKERKSRDLIIGWFNAHDHGDPDRFRVYLRAYGMVHSLVSYSVHAHFRFSIEPIMEAAVVVLCIFCAVVVAQGVHELVHLLLSPCAVMNICFLGVWPRYGYIGWVDGSHLSNALAVEIVATLVWLVVVVGFSLGLIYWLLIED